MDTKKPETLTTLALALELMRRIPRQYKVTAADLHKEVEAAGFVRDIRSIQRLLQKLAQRFDIECDDSNGSYGYRWKPQGQTLMVPGLNRQESLLLLLARQHLSPLLPPSVMRAMDGFFKQAQANLAPHQNAHREKEWLHKVRVVSETQPLLPPQLAKGVLANVTSALFDNHWLEVDYLNQKDERKQTRVMPLGLAQQGPRLYLVCRFDGYDNQRILALHRFKSAQDSGLPFKRPDFDLATYDGEGHFGVGNGERIRLQFDIDKGPGRHLLESPLSQDQNVQFTPTGYTITATVHQTLMLDRWLNSFGAGVRNVVKVPINNEEGATT
jgi:predicted DNA-binding transcriptional regulator YafY